MNVVFKIFIVLIVLGLSISSSYGMWILNDGTELIVRAGGDDGEEMDKHEKDKGRYIYYDAQGEKWVTVLDFSISPYPLVNRQVIWVEE